MSVRYSVIRPRDLDAGLIASWHAIQAADAHVRSPYFCSEFTACVGKARSDARVVVIENDGRVVGFFPFQRGVLGIGRPVGGPLSDFHGVVAAAGSEWIPTDLLRAAGLSMWIFDHHVDPAGKFATHTRSHAASPRIDLAAGFPAYVKARRSAGSDYIPKTEGLARKLGREVGEVEFTLREQSSEAVATLMSWKSQQYLQAQTTDVFSVPWTGALLRHILESDGPHFRGICSVLRVDGRIVAGHVGMQSEGVLHYWFPVYDPTFAKFSVGIILLLRMAEQMCAEGVSLIDLGKGDSDYKRRLMTGFTLVGEGHVERPASILGGLYRLRRRLERIGDGADATSLRQLPGRLFRRADRATRFR